MSKINYRKLQTQAGLTNVQAAELFAVNPTTVRRWCNETALAPTAVVLCLRSIIYGTPVNAGAFVYPDKLVAAVETLAKALQRDPSYAYSWHCNITGAVIDSGVPHLQANEAAARFMHLAFQVDALTGNEPFLGAKGDEHDTKVQE